MCIGILLLFSVVSLFIKSVLGRSFKAITLDLRKAHAVQLCAQGVIYAYWGAYWHEVALYLPLLLIQIAFAYSLEVVLKVLKHEQWRVGLGPFPIVLSINLFLWFTDALFALQLTVVAIAITSKELIKWNRAGRRVHIFNPSALGLFVAACGLIAAGSNPEHSRTLEIANTIGAPPGIILEIFLVGLVLQALFATTAITASAVSAVFLFSGLYHVFTGELFFGDSNIPVLVFLGAHLFVTDPATSPSSTLGKIVFGAVYGVSVLVLYLALLSWGAPTYYDKLLCVPILNLIVPTLDRIGLSVLKRLAAWDMQSRARKVNAQLMIAWCVLFCVMAITGFISPYRVADKPEFGLWALTPLSIATIRRT